jgi:hypothetical protein
MKKDWVLIFHVFRVISCFFAVNFRLSIGGGRKMKSAIKYSLVLGAYLIVLLALQSGAVIQDKDIIALWTFDKGDKDTDATDVSGHGHNGTFDLGATRVDGKFGPGAHFDGKKGQVITIANHDELNVTKELSIVAWVKWDKGGIVHGEPRQWPMIVSKIPINETYLLFLDTGDGVNPNKPSIAFRMKGPGTVYSKVTVKDETWYHAAGTYDGKFIKIYIDGKLSNELGVTAPIAVTSDVLTIGANKDGTSNRFDGIIDEVGIYNRGLTEDEVQKTIKGFAAVRPKDKIATVWGKLKRTMPNEL